MIYNWLQNHLPEQAFARPARLDHGRMYISVTVGIWLMALSLLLMGTIPDSIIHDLNTPTQKAMSFVIFLGTSIKIHGFLSGTRLLQPNRDIRDCYSQAMWAIVATNTGLAVYIGSLFATYGMMTLSVFGGSIGTLLIFGALWTAWDFKVEIERLNQALKGGEL